MQNTQMLRAAYLANGTFSITSAAVFVLLGAWLAPLVGLSSAWPLVIVGLGLIPFGGWLFWLARGPGLTPAMGRQVSLMDAGWVLGTIVLLAIWPDLLNGLGQALAIVIALVVALFAGWQLVGVRRLAAPASP